MSIPGELSSLDEMNENFSTMDERNSCGFMPISVVLNLFHCWDPLNATDVVWDPQVKIEKVCAP